MKVTDCPFDGVYYLSQNPDVSADGKYNTPEKSYAHFINFGQYEGRMPSAGCQALLDAGDGGDIDTGGGGGEGSGPVSTNKNLLYIGLAIVALFLLFKKK